MNEAGLLAVAFVGLLLTAGAIARDTRHRLVLELRTVRKAARPG